MAYPNSACFLNLYMFLGGLSVSHRTQNGLFALASHRCIYYELRKVASCFERCTHGELQEMQELHKLQIARR